MAWILHWGCFKVVFEPLQPENRKIWWHQNLPEIIGRTLLNVHFLWFWAEITGLCGAVGQISQMGGPEPKTYPSKPSETHVWFLKTALSGRRIGESQSAKNTVFLPKNALFSIILHYHGFCGGENDVFLFVTNFNIPLDTIPINFWSIRWNFIQKSLKSFFCQKPLPWNLILGWRFRHFRVGLSGFLVYFGSQNGHFCRK